MWKAPRDKEIPISCSRNRIDYSESFEIESDEERQRTETEPGRHVELLRNSTETRRLERRGSRICGKEREELDRLWTRNQFSTSLTSRNHFGREPVTKIMTEVCRNCHDRRTEHQQKWTKRGPRRFQKCLFRTQKN